MKNYHSLGFRSVLVYLTFLKLFETQPLIKYKITNHHLCLSPESVLYVINGVSVQQCVEECATLSECSAVNYKRRFKLCELHSYLHMYLEVRSDGSCVYVRKSDMQISKVSKTKTYLFPFIMSNALPDCPNILNNIKKIWLYF